MLDEFLDRIEDGFSLVRIAPKSKRPVSDKWTSLPTYSVGEFERVYRKGDNAGVRLGKPSKVGGKYLYVVDMDIRDPKYVNKALNELNLLFEGQIHQFPAVISGSGGESRHFYFLCEEEFGSKKLWHTEEFFIDKKGTKHWAAELELFGTGKQVLIPPSIHPDTLKPYKWEEKFDPADLPEIDPDVIKAATGFDDREIDPDRDTDPLGLTEEEAEAILAQLPDWANDRHTWMIAGMALKHEFGKKGWPLFDAWSKKGRGYDKAENKAQWDSFDNYKNNPVTMRTLGQEANARERMIDEEDLLDEFGDPLPFEEPGPDRLPRALILDEFGPPIERKEGKSPLRGVPKQILTVPGVLGLAVEHFNKTAIMDQPQFAVQAALALGSVTLGRYWRTEGNVYSSLFMLCLAGTATGKEAVRGFLTKALESSKLLPVLGPNQYASEAAVTGDLLFQPRHLAIIDEFGKLLGSSRNSANTNANEAQTALMSAYGAVAGVIKPKSYSTAGKSAKQIKEEKARLIRRPSITMIAMSTQETFFDALSNEDVASGFLNRILVVNSRMPRQLKNDLVDVPFPKKLKYWIQDYGLPDALSGYWDSEFDNPEEGNAFGEEADKPEEAEVVPMSRAAKDRLRELNQHYNDRMDALDRSGQRLAALLGRAHEMVIRIALIVGLSMNRRQPSIEVEDVDWAQAYVDFYMSEMVEAAKNNLGASPVVRLADHLIKFIVEADLKGLSINDLSRKSSDFKHMDKRGKDEVLAQLISAHDVVRAEIKGTAGGRPTEKLYIKEAYEVLVKRTEEKRGKRRNHDFV